MTPLYSSAASDVYKRQEQPNDGYTPQMYYALVVSNNIQSLGGNTLEQEQLIDFWVE